MLIRRIANCARCQKDHYDLYFTKFWIPFAPPEANGLVWTHWCACPESGDPILLMVMDLSNLISG